MKKVFLALVAVAAIATIALTGCVVKKSDVLVNWEVEGSTTFSQAAIQKEIIDCYDQAAISLGYTLMSNHTILLNSQKNLDNATNVGASIADAAKAAIEAKKLNIPFPHVIVTVNANGFDLFGSKKVSSIDYGLAANPDAKQGINMIINVAKFILDFNDVTLYVTDPNSQDFKKIDLNFVEKEQRTTSSGASYTIYEAVWEKELTTSGKGQYYVELKRNDKQFEDNVDYITEIPYVGCVAGYLGERKYPTIQASIVIDKYGGEQFLERMKSSLAFPTDYEFTK